MESKSIIILREKNHFCIIGVKPPTLDQDQILGNQVLFLASALLRKYTMAYMILYVHKVTWQHENWYLARIVFFVWPVFYIYWGVSLRCVGVEGRGVESHVVITPINIWTVKKHTCTSIVCILSYPWGISLVRLLTVSTHSSFLTKQLKNTLHFSCSSLYMSYLSVY